MAQRISTSVPLFGIAAAPSLSRSALSFQAVDASIGAAGHTQFFQPVPAQPIARPNAARRRRLALMIGG